MTKVNLVILCQTVNYFPQSMNLTGGTRFDTNIHWDRTALGTQLQLTSQTNRPIAGLPSWKLLLAAKVGFSEKQNIYCFDFWFFLSHRNTDLVRVIPTIDWDYINFHAITYTLTRWLKYWTAGLNIFVSSIVRVGVQTLNPFDSKTAIFSELYVNFILLIGELC